MPEIDLESNDESKKKINWRDAIAAGVAGAAVGGMLGVAVGDSSEALLGAVIAFGGRFLPNKTAVGYLSVLGSFFAKSNIIKTFVRKSHPRLLFSPPIRV